MLFFFAVSLFLLLTQPVFEVFTVFSLKRYNVCLKEEKKTSAPYDGQNHEKRSDSPERATHWSCCRPTRRVWCSRRPAWWRPARKTSSISLFSRCFPHSSYGNSCTDGPSSTAYCPVAFAIFARSRLLLSCGRPPSGYYNDWPRERVNRNRFPVPIVTEFIRYLYNNNI